MFCSICLETSPSGVRTMCCRKRYHKKCLDTWLATGATRCPLCRGSLKRVLKRYFLITKIPMYCSECQVYGHLFTRTPCCGKTMHIACSSDTSCEFCLDQRKYFHQFKLEDLPFESFFARVIVNGRVEYLYNYEVVGTRAIELATALKARAGNHQELRRVLRVAYNYAAREDIGEIYYPHLRWACLYTGYSNLI